jgi:hypothetical protein
VLGSITTSSARSGLVAEPPKLFEFLGPPFYSDEPRRISRYDILAERGVCRSFRVLRYP